MKHHTAAPHSLVNVAVLNQFTSNLYVCIFLIFTFVANVCLFAVVEVCTDVIFISKRPH